MREIKFRAWCTFEEKMYDNFYIDEHATYAFMHELIESVQERYEMMQYTGLKDKNGREIYEGDILNISDRYNGQTVYFQEGFYGTDEFALFELTRETKRSIEVIGNIYENPELLTDK